MTRDEVKKLLKVVSDTYDTEVTSGKIDVWLATLKEYTFPQMSAALMSYLKTDTKGYAPKPGQLIDQLPHESEASDEEAWAMVTKAIRNGCYGAKEEFAKLPPLLQKAVGSHENIEAWAMMDSERVHTVIHSQVLRSYRSERERARTDNKVPEKIRRLMQSALDALEDKDA